jgi:nicotinamide phosphoribosyltransferase
MLNNILLMTDSYKVSHYPQYPLGTNRVYSYLEARRGGEYPKVMFFGLQYFIKRYLEGPVVTKKKIEQAANLFRVHFGNDSFFNREGWEYILKTYQGNLPVRIKAVLEGTVVPTGNVLLTIENTCPRSAWLVNYLETLLVQVWYMSTTGTISREMKKIILAALVRSGTVTNENLDFKVTDFGYRGVSSPESAAAGGAAHLVNFKGTDNIAACEMLMEYYGSDMPGFSIPAAEHSTITSWGEDHECNAYENMLTQYPTGSVAVVSDSWDIHNAVRNIWGDCLRDRILARDGVLIIRPDSGDPKIILPELLDIVGERFGFTFNKKGYKVIHDKVRLIQGDGIKRETLGGIVDAVMDKKWSADCLSYGSGGGLLQSCNRDTMSMVMKCSYMEANGIPRDVFKRPTTDSSKNSKRGRLMLAKDSSGGFTTLPEGTVGYEDFLVPVFENGVLLVDQNLEEIRARATLV